MQSVMELTSRTVGTSDQDEGGQTRDEGGQTRGEGGQTRNEGEPTRDEVFHVLQNQRRRFALHHLKHAPEPVDIGELATQVAAWENDVTPEQVTSKERRRVYNALQQTHISVLDETGFVSRDRRAVEPTARAERLDIYLEVISGRDIPWSEYYLALGGVGVAVLFVVGFDVGLFASFPDIAAGVFLWVALVVSAVSNYYSQHANRLGSSATPPELRGEQ
jgi:DNA-binding transcriptional ArsR family regulator